MNDVKRRLAVFLCMVLALTTVFGIHAGEQVQAASGISFGGITSYAESNAVKVEVGAKNLYIGDYIDAWSSGKSYTDYGYLSNCKGVKYSSSNKKVITVDEAGKITVKKKGNATITIKFKGKKVMCRLQAVKSLASWRKGITGYKKAQSSAKKLIKAYGKKLTDKNRYEVLKAYRNYLAIDYSAKKAYQTNWNGKGYDCVIMNPTAGRATTICDQIKQGYLYPINPCGTIAGKMFQIKSISGTGNKVTITLQAKVTQKQLTALQFAHASVEGVTAKKTSQVDFPMYLYPYGKKGISYDKAIKGTARAAVGSNQIVVTTKAVLKSQEQYKLDGYGLLETDGWLNDYWGNKINSFRAK